MDDERWWGKVRRFTWTSDMPEGGAIRVDIGIPNGDSTRTGIEFDFTEGSVATAEIDGGPPVEVKRIRFVRVGDWEREGLARAMIAAAIELLKG